MCDDLRVFLLEVVQLNNAQGLCMVLSVQRYLFELPDPEGGMHLAAEAVMSVLFIY